NRPEYAAIWLGLSRVGVVVALVNTNLAGPSLAHCINIVAPRHVIVESQLIDTLDSARPHLADDVSVWLHGACEQKLPRIDILIEHLSGARLTGCEARAVGIEDIALNIYTSGTTGLPKAANVSHHRVILWSKWFGGMMGTSSNDRMFNCLP